MTKEQYAEWTKQLNFHLNNPKNFKGQGVITATSPDHQIFLERAYKNLKGKYDVWWEAPKFFILYGDAK